MATLRSLENCSKWVIYNSKRVRLEITNLIGSFSFIHWRRNGVRLKSHRLLCFSDSWCGHGSFIQSRAATANTTRGQSGSYHHYQYVHNLVSLASVTLGHATQGHSTLGHTTLKSRYLIRSYHTGSLAI